MAYETGRKDIAQAREALGVKQRLALGGRAGDEHDELAITVVERVDPLPGGAAVGIGENGGALEDVGLFEVVGGHGNAPRRGPRMERCHLSIVALQGERERVGRGFAREVVFCGAQAPHQDEDVGAHQCGSNRIHDVLAAVAHDGLEGNHDTNLVELLREVEGVGVLPVGGEHLRADGDDFRFHKDSF